MEISFGKLLLLLLVIVIVFGTSKLPRVGEDLGKAVANFRRSADGRPASAPDEQHADKS